MTEGTLQHPSMPRAGGRRIPWWLFATVLGVVATIVLSSFSFWGPGTEGILHVTRYTARFAFLIFIITFASAALAQLAPSPLTRWLKRNRRYMGLSFALAHFLHLGAIVAYHRAIGEVPGIVTIVGGGGAYVFIALMAATSNDWSMRKLGPRNWRRLHLAGISYVWLIFMNSYIGRLMSETPPEPKPIFAVTAALGFLALGLRIAAWVKRRKAGPRTA